ncbi:MAG: Crp/Fnr family transcriptional regulator [Bacillota bacterium]
MPHFLNNVGSSYNLNEGQLEEIKRNALNKHYKRGDVIINEGDTADGLYIIKTGYVKVYQVSENGREKTLAILTAGDIIGEMAAFGQHIRSASVKAIEHTEAILIPQYRFMELLKTIPAFGLKITEVVAERLRQANRQLAQVAGCSSRDKVLCQMLYLVERFGVEHIKGVIIQPRLTHSDIASLAGVVRETVTKLFNELEDEGIITFERRRLIIRNLGSLQKAFNSRA